MAIFKGRLFVVVMGALVLALAVGLAGMSIVTAQDEPTGETYNIVAGGSGPANTDVLAFSPSTVQIHRGDTVTWTIAGFRNVHLGDEPAEMVIVPMVDGQPMPQLNPALAFPTIESGAVYVGGDATSGLPEATTFSLVFDLEPGIYAFFCDIHPGMTGTVEVVADDVEIPSPQDVLDAQGAEVTGHIQAGVGAAFAEYFEHIGMEMPEGEGMVTVGTSAGRTSANMFFPATVVINAGETVTWVLEAENIEPHTVAGAGFEGEDFIPVEQPAGPPVLMVFGPNLLGTAPSGTETTMGEFSAINSGLMTPGMTYSLTFTEPGVYNYVCTLHPGMNGTVVVLPAA